LRGVILEAPHIPYTFNMKKVESAVTNIINGRPVTNRGALINPESLEYFEKILPEFQKSSEIRVSFVYRARGSIWPASAWARVIGWGFGCFLVVRCMSM